MVTVLDGGRKDHQSTGQEYLLSCGESIVMPAKTPHAVYGRERFKMLLTVVF